MHGALLRYKVSQRLTAAFTLLILITMAIAGSGFWALSTTESKLDKIVQDTMVKIRLSNEMLDSNAQVVSAIQGLLLETDPAKRNGYLERVTSNRKAYDTARDQLFAMSSSERGLAQRAEITRTRDIARPANQAVIDAAMADDSETAIAGFDMSEKLTADWQDAIRENVNLQNENGVTAYAEATAQAAKGRFLLSVGTVLALLASALLAYGITRSLTVPLGAATQAADRIASGDVDTKIVPVGKDETAALLRSMANMQQRLSSLIAAQRELSTQQSQGNNSYRVDASAYPGAFGQLVRETNQLVENNGALIAQIVATTASYSIGDLSVRMPPLPGEQAVITEAMETTRSNLLAVSSDIQRLAAAAAQGDFSQRGDANRFQHAFRDIVLDLNRLFDVTDSSMAEISKLLVAIAACDLTQQAKGEFAGVFAEILASAGATADNLRGIIRGIQASTSVISTSASEIAMGNSDLSQRTEQQAANLEETAASMEELTSTVRQNADHARQAAQLAQVAEESASAGDQTVREVIVTMEQIKASSARVADIISVIDGIAFQTNILALNAAVEAARAGEQGRGFAVVASEVRTLAQRSAGAAKDVKTLIEGSAEQVRQGVTLVEDAGAAMRGIANSIQQVRHAVAEIAAASQEQSAGIEQVNQAVVHMDEVTQQNAALVEEANAASKSLEEQAAVLNNAVAVFKVS